MTTVTVESHINASPDAVFRAVSDIETMPRINPDVVRVEFLSEQHEGVGTRFRETRQMGNKEHHFELEVQGYDPAARTIRYVTDTHGTIWDTTVTVSAAGEGTQVRFAMACIGSTRFKRMMNVLMQGLFRRGMVTHTKALKRYCESL
ncbi:MAG: SRPBCC family protein [Myxococcota bacterium]